jgi:hypothetical protein
MEEKQDKKRKGSWKNGRRELKERMTKGNKGKRK